MYPILPIAVTESLSSVESFNLGSDTARFSHKVEGARKTSTLKVNVEAIPGIPQLTVEIGSWLNIVGYVVELPESTNKGVQAILAWNAGEVDLPEYEDAVRTLAAT